MKRLVAGAVGALLLCVPAWGLFNVMVPVPKYRTGTYADYRGAALAFLSLYGGAALGVAWRWWRSVRLTHTIGGVEVFRAGFAGVMTLIAAWVVGAAVYGWFVLGSWEKGVGNLWGLVVIFGGALGAIVAAGAGLVWYAVHGAERSTHT